MACVLNTNGLESINMHILILLEAKLYCGLTNKC